MESDSQLLSWDFSPTPTEIKEIKQMLLSGDKDKILLSIQKIKTFTENETTLNELLRADLSEFLCDVALLDAPTIEAVCSCLENIIKSTEFYTHNHSCFTIESLIRAIFFLSKDIYSVTSLNQCLDLLVHIIQGFSINNILPEKETVKNLLQLLPLLLNKSTIDVNIKNKMGVFILGLVDLDIPLWGCEFYESLLSTTSSWFNYVDDVLEPVHPLREKFILLCCKLCYSFMRCLTTSCNSEITTKSKIQCKLTNRMLTTISNFLTNSGALYFKNLPLPTIAKDSSPLECYFQSLLYFYSDELEPYENIISHCLSELGYIQFITEVISFADFDCGQTLKRLCILLLSQIIVSLFKYVFHLPEVLGNDRNDFYRKTKEGILELPLDASNWLDVLLDSQFSVTCKTALLLYLYFYTLTANSQVVFENIYFAIVSFINFTNGLESSVLLVKIIWFVFIVAQLASTRSYMTESEMEATEKMVFILESQNDLSLVYTHHPGSLYWVFSTRISSTIQYKTMVLWLRNKSPDCREWEELIGKSLEVRFAILDVLQNESGPVLDVAFSSLKCFLSETRNNDLSSNIWFILPQMLAKFTTDSTSAMNVDYFIELSILKTPECLDMSKVIRIASLLPEVLIKSDLISVVPSLILIFQLLQLGFQARDLRAMYIFLRFNGFIQKILGGINSNISQVSSYCLKIVTVLWKNSTEVKTFEIGSFQKINIRKEIITKCLESNSTEVLSEALDFLQEVLLTNFHCNIFSIDQLDFLFVEVIFFQTINISFKTVSEQFVKTWKTLTLFLQLQSVNGISVKKELAKNPLLHELINFYIPSMKEHPEIKNFLLVWIEGNNSAFNGCCFKRKIYGGFYRETVKKLVGFLRDEYTPGDEILYEKILKSGVFDDST